MGENAKNQSRNQESSNRGGFSQNQNFEDAQSMQDSNMQNANMREEGMGGVDKNPYINGDIENGFNQNPNYQQSQNLQNPQAQQNPYYSNQQMGGGFNQNPYINQQSPNFQNSQNMQNPYNQNSQSLPFNNLFNSFDGGDFLKGALIGAGVTYLLTNENIQKGIFKMIAKGTQVAQAGVEEMRERYEDAKAELDSENS